MDAHTEQRLTDLEIKASFNEDLVEQLNQVVFQHQQQIDALLPEVSQLPQPFPEPGHGGSSQPRAEFPPHY